MKQLNGIVISMIGYVIEIEQIIKYHQQSGITFINNCFCLPNKFRTYCIEADCEINRIRCMQFIISLIQCIQSKTDCIIKWCMRVCVFFCVCIVPYYLTSNPMHVWVICHLYIYTYMYIVHNTICKTHSHNISNRSLPLLILSPVIIFTL